MKICFNKTLHFERQIFILMGINDNAERFWGGECEAAIRGVSGEGDLYGRTRAHEYLT